MSCERVRLLHEIQAVEFAAVDLTLYLDTHPTDLRALMDYNDISLQLRELKQAYETRYGPLCAFGTSPGGVDRWHWIDDPWPWDAQM